LAWSITPAPATTDALAALGRLARKINVIIHGIAKLVTVSPHADIRQRPPLPRFDILTTSDQQEPNNGNGKLDFVFQATSTAPGVASISSSGGEGWGEEARYHLVHTHFSKL
jgi:hypothetical protein